MILNIIEIFFVLFCYQIIFSAHGSDEHNALASSIYPLASQFQSEVFLDSELFSRVKYVFENPKGNLSAEDLKLVEYYFIDFELSVANLSA